MLDGIFLTEVVKLLEKLRASVRAYHGRPSKRVEPLGELVGGGSGGSRRQPVSAQVAIVSVYQNQIVLAIVMEEVGGHLFHWCSF